MRVCLCACLFERERAEGVVFFFLHTHTHTCTSVSAFLESFIPSARNSLNKNCNIAPTSSSQYIYMHSTALILVGLRQ